MSLSLQTSPLASDAAAFALNNSPFSNAAYYGSDPTLHSSLFTNGLSAGFNVDTGVLFTTQNTAGAVSNPASGEVGLTFQLSSGYRMQLTHCSCDGDGADSKIIINSPASGSQQYDLYLNPNERTTVPRSSFPSLPSSTGPDCTCRSGPYSFTLSGNSQIGLQYSGEGSDFLFYGFSGAEDLPGSTTTSYTTTVTETATVSTVSTTTTTTPYAYTTTTSTPPADTVTVTPTTYASTTLPASTVTVTPAVSTTTSTAAPTCTVYQLTFPSACCPRGDCQKGAATLGPVPKATPAPSNNHRRVNSGEVESPAYIRRDDSGCAVATGIASGTIVTTSLCPTTTQAAPVTVYTSTTTVTEASSYVASETAPTPSPVTITESSTTITSSVTVTPSASTTTLPAVTQTMIAAAPCTTNSVAKFTCPANARNQLIVSQLTKVFLDLYKRLASPRAPQLSVQCEGDSTLYNY